MKNRAALKSKNTGNSMTAFIFWLKKYYDPFRFLQYTTTKKIYTYKWIKSIDYLMSVFL